MSKLKQIRTGSVTGSANNFYLGSSAGGYNNTNGYFMRYQWTSDAEL